MTPEFEERLYRSGVAHDDGFATGARRQGLLRPELANRIRRTEPQRLGRAGAQGRAHACRRTGLPVRDDPNGGVDHPRDRYPRDERPHPRWSDERRHHDRARLHRTRVRVRRRGGGHQGRARRRRVGHQRLQDVHHQRPHCRLHLLAGAHEPREAKTPGADDVSRTDRVRRFRSPSGMDAVRGAHEHHVLRRRPHRRRVAYRRSRCRLAGARALVAGRTRLGVGPTPCPATAPRRAMGTKHR